MGSKRADRGNVREYSLPGFYSSYSYFTKPIQNFRNEDAGNAIMDQADSRQPDISYHFFIDFRGDIAEGRELKYMIVPSAGYDGSGLIHITLEGDFTQESPNNKQIDSLVRLIRLLRHTHEIEIEEIKGHKDFVSTTLCPGNLYIMLSQIRDEVQ